MLRRCRSRHSWSKPDTIRPRVFVRRDQGWFGYTELDRGVAYERRLLRHHNLLGAVVHDALVLDVTQVLLV